MDEESKLNRIEDKVDILDERLGRIEVTLTRNTENLAEHMRRTALLEVAVLPLARRGTQIDGVFKALGFISATIATIYTVIKIFNLL